VVTPFFFCLEPGYNFLRMGSIPRETRLYIVCLVSLLDDLDSLLEHEKAFGPSGAHQSCGVHSVTETVTNGLSSVDHREYWVLEFLCTHVIFMFIET